MSPFHVDWLLCLCDDDHHHNIDIGDDCDDDGCDDDDCLVQIIFSFSNVTVIQIHLKYFVTQM